MKKENKHLMILFSVLLFGGLWGILEATLGTILHLPVVNNAGMYLCSTTIMVPIAFYLMAACYKRTNTFHCTLYMGILAASIKALVCLIFRLSFNPVYYILLESVCMMGALAAIRPTKVLSFQGLATMILASTSYLALAMLIMMDITRTTANVFMAQFEKYVFMFNCVAIIYTFASGAIMFGLVKLAERFEWKFEKIKKVLYSPITASVVASIMVVTTFLLR